MKILDNVVALFLVVIIVSIIIPLSPVMLDTMLIINITLSICILLITMYTKKALEFSVFPSLLLITTLFRVSLNVSSTRLILGNGGNAGNVIHTFGSFVIGSNVVVGVIVFIIIIIVQFIVITKGAERVAEVSARFTLDAMPGKQMSIDADLNTGLINEQQARQRRLDIQREADFYGAMDGASKFVKGDAIISILIVFINIIAGTIIGMVQGGKTINEVMSIYTIATIGDGLVSQLPALMISTATGMIVTRAASENSLSFDLSRQIISQPVVLIIAGCLLLFLCLIPGMPLLQLIIIGGLLIAGGLILNQKKAALVDHPADEELPVSESEFYRNPDNIYSLLTVEPIEVEFGYSLIPLADESKSSNFIDRVVMLRRQIALDLGIVLPSVRLKDNTGLSPNMYVIKIRGEEIARGEVLVDHFLAMDSGNVEQEVEGIDTKEPAFGISAKWIRSDLKETAELFGYTVIDPLSVIITHFSEIMKKHAAELIGRKEVNQLLENIKKDNKAIVDDIIPSVISSGDLQKVLANLLTEQVPIRDLTSILEAIGEYGPTIKDTDLLTEYVRQALKRTITRKFTDGEKVKVIAVSPDIENIIMGSIKKSEQGSYISMDPETMQKLVAAHMAEINKLGGAALSPIILTSPVVRLYYKKIIEQYTPDITVLSFNEIESSVQIQSVGIISFSDNKQV